MSMADMPSFMKILSYSYQKCTKQLFVHQCKCGTFLKVNWLKILYVRVLIEVKKKETFHWREKLAQKVFCAKCTFPPNIKPFRCEKSTTMGGKNTLFGKKRTWSLSSILTNPEYTQILPQTTF